ncbi:hypothetical protein CTI12_AA166520 [Artemisia annua]|uniref:non-specific serine/threonine protein kinase n=1 Tax=Artemisia annua TaxID=35608 RepID=A0A2U1NZU7_ARTAN|nr:hypothetical protein CTI12_AA166520 [Artemisia annua]
MTNLLHHTTFLLLLLFTTTTLSDDGAVMSILSSSLTPPPATWQTKTHYCKWEGISCDHNSQVTSINLPSLSLTGTLPPDLNNLSSLETLAVQKNMLHGSIPTLNKLYMLDTLLLDGNNFTFFPKDFFIGLGNLETFSISDNLDLAPWVIPESIVACSNLKSFVASNANIYGTIPDVFDNLLSLEDLRLSYNNLTGELPLSFGKAYIGFLWLNNQRMGLSGGIDVLGSMVELRQVWLQGNAFSGVIPASLGSDSFVLFDVQLRDNLLTGIVPVEITKLHFLLNISLQNNKLQGPVPVFGSDVKVELGEVGSNSFCLEKPGDCDYQVNTLLEIAGELGYPLSLAESWKGNDACAGWEFVSCDANKNVTSVNFAKQNFSGTISPAFANLTSLRSISLDGNNMVGPIPKVLTSLKDLQLLDVSRNNLSGIVPAFSPKVKFLDDNNPFLGVNISTLSPPPGSASNISASSGSLAKRSKRTVGSPESGKELVPESVLGSSSNRYGKEVVVKESVAGSSSNPYGVVSELQSQSSGDHSEMQVFEGGNVMISCQVLRQVTNNFNEDNVLGHGGFGVVYKGELHDGTEIAVKRMEIGVKGTKGMNEFQAEIGVLTKVRHRHLVALLGYCANDNERLLVYEYMPKGTLSQHLFDWSENNSQPLSWKQRVSIALDVGRGVEYLHSLAQQSFIHRDLKPSNILLGDDMRAKVADFGLVKNATDGKGGKFSIETKVAGTFGYLAPEYAATGRVTTKVDVYAFGVVLMELITGRKALDETMPDERCHLVSWFRRVIITKENIVKSIDQTLDTENEDTLESIIKVAELAGHCTAREPFQRPDMCHAVNVLGPLVEQWKPSKHEEVEESYSHRMSLPEVLQRWQAGEGSSRTFDMSFSQTQSSIPNKPSGFSDTFDSSDCR